MSIALAIVLLVLVLLVLVVVTLFSSATLWSAMGADAPWVPLDRRSLAGVLTLVGELPVGAVVADLGSGDGRVLRAIARRHPHVRGHGIEQSRILTWWSRARARRRRLNGIRYTRGDFLRVPLVGTDVVCCFLWPQVMATLAPKFQRELAPGARVISAWFAIPGWEPQRVIRAAVKGCAIYEYVIGARGFPPGVPSHAKTPAPEECG